MFSIGFSFVGTCFSAIFSIGQIDQDETWAQGILACDLIFIAYSYNKKNQYFRVLPLAPNVNNWRISHPFVYEPLRQRPAL